jgi:hypothetical protein
MLPSKKVKKTKTHKFTTGYCADCAHKATFIPRHLSTQSSPREETGLNTSTIALPVADDIKGTQCLWI